MTFVEKSSALMAAALIAVFGWYFWQVVQMSHAGVEHLAPTGLILGVAIGVLVAAAIAGHIVIAIQARLTADDSIDMVDERDQRIATRGAAIAGSVLAVGVLGVIGAAFFGASPFWMVQGLIASMVLAELAQLGVMVISYRVGR